jgi:hypothetical protein
VVPDEFLGYFASGDRLRNRLQPINQSTFTGVSQLSQNASFSMTHLLEKPALSVRTVMNRSKHLEFNFITHTSVPFFFSFFRVMGIWNVHSFYEKIQKQAKADLAVRIKDPFFNSPSKFRFLAHALDLAVTADTDRNSLIPQHCEYLLPFQHLSLLQKLHLRGRSVFPNFFGAFSLAARCTASGPRTASREGR